MIPVKDKTKVTDSINGSKTLMTVRSEDWSKISGLLINLYSDVVKAVVREYSTNAFDSHVEAGVKRPIEITTPNDFSNLFVVRDFGTGMTRDTLEKVYCMFGASTKDKSNDFNGSMGLGSKSALTYSDAFTIISVKDGKQNTAIVSRDEEGNGVMELLDEQDTEEPNGTTIQVPARAGDEHRFLQKANEFYAWWPEDSVLVNGKPIQRMNLANSKFEEISPGNWVKTGDKWSSVNRLTVVMGNVTYVHEIKEPDPRLKAAIEIISYVPNGSVMFAPSRESLLMNRATTKYVDSLIKEVVDAYVDKITKEMASSANLKDAIAAFQKYNNVLNDGVSEWNGIKLGTSDVFYGRYYSVLRDETSKAGGYVSVNSGYSDKTIWLTDFGSGNLTRQQKDALTEYRNTLPDDEKFSTVYYQGSPPPLFADARMLNYEQIIKPLVKKSQVSSPKGAIVPTFDMFYWDSKEKMVKRNVRAIAKNKTILYTSPKDIRRADGWGGSRFYSFSWIEHMKNVIVVVIGTNRHIKFKKDNPKAQHLRTYIREWTDKQAKSVTPDEKEALTEENMDALKELAGKTLDKHIDKLAAALVSYEKKSFVVAKVTSKMYMSDLTETVMGGRFYNRKSYLGKHYPLASLRNSKATEHTIKYINMIYKEENK